MTNKIIIAKPGFNVLTETDPNNLIYSSDYDTLKYHLADLVTVTVDWSQYYHSETGGLGTFYYHRKVQAVSHGLSYSPHFVGYTTGIIAQMPLFFGDAGFSVSDRIYADATNIYFVLDRINKSNSGTSDIDFRYRIFRNSLGI